MEEYLDRYSAGRRKHYLTVFAVFTGAVILIATVIVLLRNPLPEQPDQTAIDASILETNEESSEASQLNAVSLPGRSDLSATVGPEEARFVFPIEPGKIYEWCSGGLVHGAEVVIEQKFEFGFTLFTPMGATPCDRGGIRRLLLSGQTSAWRNQPDGNSYAIPGDYSTELNATGDSIEVVLRGRDGIGLLFGNKPDSVTMIRTIDGRATRNNVKVMYLGKALLTAANGNSGLPLPHSRLERLNHTGRQQSFVILGGATSPKVFGGAELKELTACLGVKPNVVDSAMYDGFNAGFSIALLGGFTQTEAKKVHAWASNCSPDAYIRSGRWIGD
uniref:hypothetical protein n=1 Tax=Parerythrobacter lutipelagi TaxID=1964208 RepID=UPI0013759E9E|nr:hypothetical protein [Parerythrobacter lutipelagi]